MLGFFLSITSNIRVNVQNDCERISVKEFSFVRNRVDLSVYSSRIMVCRFFLDYGAMVAGSTYIHDPPEGAPLNQTVVDESEIDDGTCVSSC